MNRDLTPFDCTPEQFKAVRDAFFHQGVYVPDEAAGTISQHGVEARFTYDGITLRVTVTGKPWLITQEYVVSHLSAFIDGAIESTPA